MSAACGAVWPSPVAFSAARPSSWFTRRATAASSATATVPSSEGATASRRSALLPVTESPASHWTWNPRVPSAVRRPRPLSGELHRRQPGPEKVGLQRDDDARPVEAEMRDDGGAEGEPVRLAQRRQRHRVVDDVPEAREARSKSASTARVDGLLIVGDSSTIARAVSAAAAEHRRDVPIDLGPRHRVAPARPGRAAARRRTATARRPDRPRTSRRRQRRRLVALDLDRTPVALLDDAGCRTRRSRRRWWRRGWARPAPSRSTPTAAAPRAGPAPGSRPRGPIAPSENPISDSTSRRVASKPVRTRAGRQPDLNEGRVVPVAARHRLVACRSSVHLVVSDQ